MYIGADDNGNIVGLDKIEDIFDKIPDKIRATLGILPEIKLERKNNLKYIKIKIDKYQVPISYHGKFYLRSGRSNHEATASEYDQLLLERYGKTWDSMPVFNVTVEDLDKNSIERFKMLAVDSKRLKPEDVNIDDKSLLENLKLLDNGHLTMAAILLFHKDPEKWIPSAYTRIAFFEKDDAHLKYQDEIHGSLIFQAEEIARILYSKYLKAFVSFKGMQRIDEYIIPEVAAREIIYNFLQHKAYNTPIPTQIKVYDDFLYIWNPGELPDEVKDILFQKHPSKPRNLKVSQTFFRAGFVEYWGTGIKRITDACKEYGSPIPEIVNEAGGVAVKCKPSKSYLKAMLGENKSLTAQTSPKYRPNIAQTIKGDIEINIIEIIKQNNKITQNEIAEILNVSRDIVKRNIKKLKDNNKLKREGNKNNGYWKIL